MTKANDQLTQQQLDFIEQNNQIRLKQERLMKLQGYATLGAQALIPIGAGYYCRKHLGWSLSASIGVGLGITAMYYIYIMKNTKW